MDYEATPLKIIKRRRRHTPELKQQVLGECEQPGVSVASIALRHGLNQNLIYRWRRIQMQDAQNDFVRLPMTLPAPANPTGNEVSVASATLRIELPSATGPIHVHWPIADAALSVDWLRALMR
jgi:transposase-like protein